MWWGVKNTTIFAGRGVEGKSRDFRFGLCEFSQNFFLRVQKVGVSIVFSFHWKSLFQNNTFKTQVFALNLWTAGDTVNLRTLWAWPQAAAESQCTRNALIVQLHRLEAWARVQLAQTPICWECAQICETCQYQSLTHPKYAFFYRKLIWKWYKNIRARVHCKTRRYTTFSILRVDTKSTTHRWGHVRLGAASCCIVQNIVYRIAPRTVLIAVPQRSKLIRKWRKSTMGDGESTRSGTLTREDYWRVEYNCVFRSGILKKRKKKKHKHLIKRYNHQ